jgi:hypothetical protein
VLLSTTLVPNVRNVETEFLELKTSGDDLRRIRRCSKAFGSGGSDEYLQRRLLGMSEPWRRTKRLALRWRVVLEHAASAMCSLCRTLP